MAGKAVSYEIATEYFDTFQQHRKITIPLAEEKIVLSAHLTIAPVAATPVVLTDGGKHNAVKVY